MTLSPRGNNGNARRSFAFAQAFACFRIPLNHAPWTNSSELARTAAPARQAGGHWFEPSAAPPNLLETAGFSVFQFSCSGTSESLSQSVVPCEIHARFAAGEDRPATNSGGFFTAADPRT